MAEREVCYVSRVELVWPGKYHADGTRRQTPVPRLPLVRVEVINARRPPRRRRPEQLALF